jgi:cell division protein FtsZ
MALTGYSIRHTIATISDLLTRPGMICIDFADVQSIFMAGSIGRISVGVANDHARGATAAMLAIERLDAQQGLGTEIVAALVCLHGSYDVTMDDYEDASRVIHNYLPEDSNIIFGMLIDEQMGRNVRVTMMAVTKGLL